MRKRIAALFTLVLLTGLAAGCGASGNNEAAGQKDDASTATTAYVAYDGSTKTEAEEEVKEETVFNIYSIEEN